MKQRRKATVYYHLPGLFEFHELYCEFLPLFREHREYFYDWCGIGSVYGAPADCIWGGGRIGYGDYNPRKVLALMQEYGISSRLTFSNSLLEKRHLSDQKCNQLCAIFEEKNTPRNGVIIHSDLLLDYLKRQYPGFYFVSSTTKVLTDFQKHVEEINRDDFLYVVPDFRLNKSLENLNRLSQQQKDKWNFCATNAVGLAAKTGRNVTKQSAAEILERTARNIFVLPLTEIRAIVFQKQWKIPDLSVLKILKIHICPWDFPILKSRAGDLAVP